jgi:UDP:flavonoid glycosyltransferase YjiC (YdhE family)
MSRKPMRVLFTALPATGHVHSILPLAVAVRDAGHDVAVATGTSSAPTIQAHGLGYLAAGVDRFGDLFEGAPSVTDPNLRHWVARVAFGTRGPQRMVPDLQRHLEAWRPDVLVRESAELAAALVAEARGLPHAAVSAGAWASLDARRATIAEHMAQHRESLGLEPDPEGRMLFRYLQLGFTPPSWEGDAPIPDTLHHIRYDVPQRPGDVPPPWLPRRAGRRRPFVFASLGTVMHSAEGLMEAIVAALGELDLDAVVAIGRDQDPARFGSLPAHVRIEPYVPQLHVLRAADLFVTHGGFNGTKEALRLGVPLVVTPINGDQPYTAERVAALGLGLAIGPGERSAQRIGQAIQEVLAQDRYRSAAADFAAEMAALPPISHAVRLLERLARDRVPITRVQG